ncbi:hypothetical protein VHEMI08921 [[Torrubiella] hemipterigena]|nr:hypothetical protein VHEMI08921 [[Torrubiella] hemipterigena]
MSPDDMQNRIDRLEGLVLSLMHNGSSSSEGPSTGDTRHQSMSQSASGSSVKMEQDEDLQAVEESDDEESLSKSLGFLKVDPAKGKSMYIGAEHWHTILADIADVKNYFSTHKEEMESSYEKVKSSKTMSAREGPTLLFGAIPASEIELRNGLPLKHTVLALCSRYFNSMDNAVSVIHGPTFIEQLKTHWKDPSKTPMMWLGLLYSVLCLAMLSYGKVGDEPGEYRGKTTEMAEEFRLRTVQCLMKADYTRPVDYTVETMLLYLLGEYTSRWDADLGLWMIHSMVIRVAYRMGYHRDAKSFPNISPFQAEMRRRTWCLMRMTDSMFSHQVSLPSMINPEECDTLPPSNLNDDDLSFDMLQPPTPRPLSEPTPISYMICKAQLVSEVGNILSSTHKIKQAMPYDDILRFDAKLLQVMQEMPPHLKLTGNESLSDPVTLVVARYNVSVLYQKILCMLHRHYVKRARTNPRYAHSRRRAIDASMQAMEHLATLYRESSQPNGKLRSINWYIKSIATKDFTLPAMLIILDLHYDNLAIQSNSPQDHDGAFLWDTEQRAKMIAVLENARGIWKSLATSSMEAFKASKVVELMIDKIRTPPTSTEASPAAPFDMGIDGNLDFAINTTAPGMMEAPAGMQGFGTANPFANASVDAFAGMGMDFGLPPMNYQDIQMNGAGGAMSPLSMFTTLDQGIETASTAELNANFDWSAFENYAQMSNWATDQSFQIYANQMTEDASPGSGAGSTGQQ